MSSKISDERLAELIEFHGLIRDSSHVSPEVYQYRSDEVNALAELAEYRAREAESGWETDIWHAGIRQRRRVGPWEAVSDDE